MQRHFLATSFVLICALVAFADPDTKSPTEKPAEKQPATVKVSPAMQDVLDKINSVDAYQLPDLELKTDKNYAETVQELEPFRHVKPYKQHFLRQLEYTGPGRAIPEPENLKSVKIGFLGPITPTVSVATGGQSHEEELGKMMLKGCQMAIEETNAKGGYLKRNIPFELVVSNDNGLWGSSGNEITKQAYEDEVWAIQGTIDGANSHIAIRVAMKTELLMLNSGDTDPTFVETNIPWVVRCIGDDRQMNYLLIDYMYHKLNLRRVGIMRASNRYGRFGVREIKDSSRRLGRPVVLEMAYQLGLEDFSLHLDRIQQANVDAVVHWGDAKDGSRILNQMREMGMKQPYFACDRCVSDEFVKIAGENAEGVVCGFPWDPTRDDPLYVDFCERFEKRFDMPPETQAAHAFDGMNLLIWATQVAGLNRAKIRDVLAHRTEPYPGVTGDIRFSAALGDVGEVYLAKYEKGSWKYYSRGDLSLDRVSGKGVSSDTHEETSSRGAVD